MDTTASNGCILISYNGVAPSINDRSLNIRDQIVELYSILLSYIALHYFPAVAVGCQIIVISDKKFVELFE
ncbi:hypothetical protein HJA_09204 [Hyphomonas jannaschiana VP2]|uniref:Uncharacterized protein n=1 Tax=Hyphomonas jannaschiana VP2 TaxID=1280952 RepID=A0A059FD54_9PROT|nr:hypothetical protein HJA_09204 [Hyphomonas jannaschiana VP2]